MNNRAPILKIEADITNYHTESLSQTIYTVLFFSPSLKGHHFAWIYHF